MIYPGGGKNKRTLRLCTAEAEYIAQSAATQKTIWQLINEIDPCVMKGPMSIFCGKNVAVDLAQREDVRHREKHIDIRYHILRNKVESEKISLNQFKSCGYFSCVLLKRLKCTKQMALFSEDS